MQNGSDTARSWLMSQARLFGSAIRNYQQALKSFDQGIDTLSRKLAANIDGNIRFEKIERIEGHLTSKVTTTGLLGNKLSVLPKITTNGAEPMTGNCPPKNLPTSLGWLQSSCKAKAG